MIASDIQGTGLGSALMEKLIRYCRERGTGRLTGVTLGENGGMRKLARKFGFREQYCSDNTVHLMLDLQELDGQQSGTITYDAQ